MGWMSVKSFGAVTVMVVSRGRDLRKVKKDIAAREFSQSSVRIDQNFRV